MEMIGMKACLKEILSDWKLSVDFFVTDRHIQIRAYMRDTYGPNRKDKSLPLIHHRLDIWHVAKSMWLSVNVGTKDFLYIHMNMKNM